MIILFLSVSSTLVQLALSYSNCLDGRCNTLFRSNSLFPLNFIKYNNEIIFKSRYLKSSLLVPPPVISKGFENDDLLPWKTSINMEKSLSYMPMLEKQLDIIKTLRMKEEQIDSKFVYKSSNVKPAKIASLCFKNEKFRKVRMTYIDAGDSVQVLLLLLY